MKVNRFAAGMLAAGILLTALGGCAEDAPENPPASPSTSISVSPTQMPSEPDTPPVQTEAPSATKKTFAELAPTTTMEFAELVGDNGIYEIPEKFPEKGTYKVVVDIYHQVVLVYSRDESGGIHRARTVYDLHHRLGGNPHTAWDIFCRRSPGSL